MQYNESNYAEEERAAYQRGDVALAGLLAACDAYAQDGAAMARECELVHDTLAESIAACADLRAALQWIADHGDIGAAGRPAYHDMRDCARSALAKVAA